jgi:hypothetical protein
LHQPYQRLRNRFGRTRWYSKVTRLKWMLVSVHFEIVLTLTQVRCSVCVERTIGSKIIVGRSPWISYVTLVMWNVVLVHVETVLVSVKDRCMVCAKHTIGSKII